MPTPAYIDTAAYLPLGGVNGFEVNGYDINGVAFVESPFAGAFLLDPFRSFLPAEPKEGALAALYPSQLASESTASVQMYECREDVVPDEFTLASPLGESSSSKVAGESVSLEIDISDISVVSAEARVSYVTGSHPNGLPRDLTVSDVVQQGTSSEPEEIEVSIVPREDRTVTVPRGDS